MQSVTIYYFNFKQTDLFQIATINVKINSYQTCISIE